MTTAIITLASRARLDHLRRQEEWIRTVAPDAIRVIVQLDAEPDEAFGGDAEPLTLDAGTQLSAR